MEPFDWESELVSSRARFSPALLRPDAFDPRSLPYKRPEIRRCHARVDPLPPSDLPAHASSFHLVRRVTLKSTHPNPTFSNAGRTLRRSRLSRQRGVSRFSEAKTQDSGSASTALSIHSLRRAAVCGGIRTHRSLRELCDWGASPLFRLELLSCGNSIRRDARIHILEGSTSDWRHLGGAPLEEGLVGQTALRLFFKLPPNLFEDHRSTVRQ
jgi:hypothetical protein